MSRPTPLLPGLVRFEDTCNVYVFACGDCSVAVDFGSGSWQKDFAQLGLPSLGHVYLTHHHPDQCAGLLRRGSRGFIVHTPPGERALLTAAGIKAARQPRGPVGVPASYAMIPRGLRGVRYDMEGFGDHFVGTRRVRFIDTPGHGPGAVSLVIEHERKQVLFCCDAAHDGATIWQPYHLEWDHWTDSGALAAWQGVRRIADLRVDLLCPAHGPIVDRQPRTMLRRLARKLLAVAAVKGNICPGEPDRYVEPIVTASGARRVCENLYQFGMNGYLLVSRTGDALVMDPHEPDMAQLDRLLAELSDVRITDMTATHYHCDHVDGAPSLKRKTGAALHPRVARPLGRPSAPSALTRCCRAAAGGNGASTACASRLSRARPGGTAVS